jgi:hypothetical protein
MSGNGCLANEIGAEENPGKHAVFLRDMANVDLATHDFWGAAIPAKEKRRSRRWLVG